MSARGLALLAIAGCHGGVSHRVSAVRPACTEAQYWDGARCVARGEVATKLAASQEALEIPEPDAARAALDEVAKAGPLLYAANVTLWAHRAIVASFLDQDAAARSAFEMLLALDPGHFLSYLISPKATQRFEVVRNEAKQRPAPAVEINWANGQRVGAPVTVDVTVVADPKQFLRTATLFVRTRGEPTWRAADLTLGTAGAGRQVVLPPVVATAPQSLELYLRAYDDHGNEVLAWADARRPREIPLRYDPPRPWWQKWWVITLAGTAAAMGTGAIVYAATLSPPDRVDGSVSVR